MPDASTKISSALSPLPKRHAESHSDRVLVALQQAILDGSLPPGTSLIERELAEMLGFSKTPIREALKILQSSGLIEPSTRSWVVRRLDAATVHSLYAARVAVEPQALKLGVELLGKGPRPGARKALESAQALLGADDQVQLGLANRQFHRELYLACGNEWLIDFLDKLQTLNTFLATTGWRISPRFDAEAREHREILEAVEEGDAERSEKLIREHILGASKALLSSLEDHDLKAATA